MNYIARFGAVILAFGSLAGCGGEDFSGAYRADGSYGKYIVLNISGDHAKVFLFGKSSAEISGVTDFTVDHKNEKLILESKNENIRFVFKRGVDERGLDCLNCNDLSPRFPTKWDFVQSKPFDIDAMLKGQEEHRQAAAKEAEKRRAEAAKLTKFQGDWVSKRHGKNEYLLIMSMSPSRGVKFWAFNYESANKMAEADREFEVDGDEIVIHSGDHSDRYAVSEDGKRLICKSCKSEHDWFKADPVKVNNFDYTRELAGNPQG